MFFFGGGGVEKYATWCLKKLFLGNRFRCRIFFYEVCFRKMTVSSATAKNAEKKCANWVYLCLAVRDRERG